MFQFDGYALTVFQYRQHAADMHVYCKVWRLEQEAQKWLDAWLELERLYKLI